MTPVVLGIDTSCYTTSCALADLQGNVLQNRRLLTVEQGERGLQQSTGLFQHVNRLPEILQGVLEQLPDHQICAVCVSDRPRPQQDSYMPVFLAGSCVAQSIAMAMNVPLYRTSHQQGHVRAARIGSTLKADRFVALHLSGGTTESLLVDRDEIALIGGSNDLHAGQFVDRAGVALGLPFPAGPHLEKLARGGSAVPLIKLAHRDGYVSFSGAESQVQRMVAEGSVAPADIAMEVYHYIARAVAQIIIYAHEQTGAPDVLLAGGVASSALLRDLLSQRLRKKKLRVRLHWARPEYAGDNACGVALIGLEQYMRCEER